MIIPGYRGGGDSAIGGELEVTQILGVLGRLPGICVASLINIPKWGQNVPTSNSKAEDSETPL